MSCLENVKFQALLVSQIPSLYQHFDIYTYQCQISKGRSGLSSKDLILKSVLWEWIETYGSIASLSVAKTFFLLIYNFSTFYRTCIVQKSHFQIPRLQAWREKGKSVTWLWLNYVEIPSYPKYAIRACLGGEGGIHQWTDGSKSPVIKYVAAGLKFHINVILFWVRYNKVVLRVDLALSTFTFMKKQLKQVHI
jgi:hypothetical protein